MIRKNDKKANKDSSPSYFTVQASKFDPNFIRAVHESTNNSLASYIDIYKTTYMKRVIFNKLVDFMNKGDRYEGIFYRF